MTEWEYRVIDDVQWGALGRLENMDELMDTADLRHLHSEDGGFMHEIVVLDQFGENGWELCGIDEPIGIANPEVVEMAPNNGQWTRAWLFKRKKGSTQKWEYDTSESSVLELNVRIKAHTWWTSKDADMIRKVLNSYGKNGWELCAISSNGPTRTLKPYQNREPVTVLIYYFKRPKKD